MSMDWVSDVSVGSWIVDAVADRPWGSLRMLVPDTFEAYARVLHPFESDRVANLTWRQIEREHERTGSDVGEMVRQPVSWAEVARVFGTVMHPLAQSHRLVGRKDPTNMGDVVGPDGWRYDSQEIGRMNRTLLARVAGVLAEATSTPDEGIVAIWEGFGGLVSSAGSVTITAVEDSGPGSRLIAMGNAFAEPIRNAYSSWKDARATPGSGLLPKSVATGPRLELPGRDYVLFRSGIEAFASQTWSGEAPWVDRLERGSEWVQTPSLIWPEDRAWFMASEIDFDSTIVAGSRALIDQLLATEGIEAARIDLDADLSSEGDRINGGSQ